MALGRTSLWIPEPRFARLHGDFEQGADIGSPGRTRATETLGLDASHFLTEDTLLKKINGLKSMLVEQHILLQGQEAFLCMDSGLLRRKKNVASLQSFQQQLLTLYFTIKQ